MRERELAILFAKKYINCFDESIIQLVSSFTGSVAQGKRRPQGCGRSYDQSHCGSFRVEDLPWHKVFIAQGTERHELFFYATA